MTKKTIPSVHSQSQLHEEHKRTLSELERYKLLVESVQDYAIFFMDQKGYIQTWNKGAENAKGYKPKEIIGKHFSLFYSEQDKADKKPERELEIAKKVGRVEDEDWRIRKDGSKFWANVVITALYDDDGTLQGFAKVTRNLTERKQNEDRLKASNLLLQEQQTELQRLNDAKDDFISLASHQLRTPATAIKQLLGMIVEGFYGEVPADLEKTIQKAYDSNERQIDIVNSLLRVAQIDSGKVVLRQTSVDLNVLINELVKQYDGIIRDKNQTITLSLYKQPVYGRVDEHYYRMALENILDNASKYTEEGGAITIITNITDDHATVSIRDSGVGISSEHYDSLFEKFNRIPNQMSHKVAGSGLGLYWVQKVINLHRGNVTVDSELEQGTTFTVSVPKDTVNA